MIILKYNYTWTDDDHDNINTDELLKNLEAEILKEE